jgi:hypothetical protein
MAGLRDYSFRLFSSRQWLNAKLFSAVVQLSAHVALECCMVFSDRISWNMAHFPPIAEHVLEYEVAYEFLFRVVVVKASINLDYRLFVWQAEVNGVASNLLVRDYTSADMKQAYASYDFRYALELIRNFTRRLYVRDI